MTQYSNIICLVALLSLFTVLQAYPYDSSSVATAASTCDIQLSDNGLFSVKTKCYPTCTRVTVEVFGQIKVVDIYVTSGVSQRNILDMYRYSTFIYSIAGKCVVNHSSSTCNFPITRIPVEVNFLNEASTAMVLIGISIFPQCSDIQVYLPRCS